MLSKFSKGKNGALETKEVKCHVGTLKAHHHYVRENERGMKSEIQEPYLTAHMHILQDQSHGKSEETCYFDYLLRPPIRSCVVSLWNSQSKMIVEGLVEWVV